MNRFFAICPFCHRSIYAEENLSGGYACSHCGQALGLNYLKENKLIVDMEKANEEYYLAQEYFMNTDFREAGEHFRKVLIYDKNNYLAEYYHRLCAIYENEGVTEGFNTPKEITDAVKSAIEKMTLSLATIANKTEFLSTVLNQTYIILLNDFNRICAAYEEKELWDDLRRALMNLAAEVKSLLLVDKEVLMVYEETISKSLISISDLAICACQKVVAPHLVDNKRLDIPTDYDYDTAKEFYGTFYYYATSLDPNYTFNSYKPDFTSNLLYNESVITELDKYNQQNRGNRKKFLTGASGELSTVISNCQLAIKYSYHTCFKGLYPVKNDQARTALVNESIAFCFETLMPRISIAEQKKVAIDVKNFAKAGEIAFYLNEFLRDFADYNKRLAAEYVNRFYAELHEMVKLYFSIVYNSYNKFVNKLKETQNAEFKYYKNFLYQIVCCCSLALKEIIDYDQHKLSDRVKILKLGKQVTEEFLLLSDYKIDEIERSPKYADILDVYNALDESIELFSKK